MTEEEKKKLALAHYNWSNKSPSGYSVSNLENYSVNLQNTNLKNTPRKTIVDPVIYLKNKAIYDAITPSIYPGDDNPVSQVIVNALKNLYNKRVNNINREQEDPYSEDAWALYLGQPQKYNSLTESKYRPTKETNPNSKYYALPEEFNVDLLKAITQLKAYPPFVEETDLDRVKYDKSIPYEESFMPSYMYGPNSEQSRAHSIGNFKIDYGEDENGEYVSYYDKWDLAPFGNEVDVSKVAGEPYEIYNRIYLNKKKPKK